jgi:signal peptidase II
VAEAERTIGTPDTHASGASGAGQADRRDGRAEQASSVPAERPDQAHRADRPDQTGPQTSEPVSPDAESPEPGSTGPADHPAPDPDPDPDTRTPRKGTRKIAVLLAVAALAYLLDVISKVLVVAKLEHHEPVNLLGDWLRLDAIRNRGAAFSMGQAYTVIFTVIAVAVIVVIVRLSRKLYSLPWAIALGLLLGGAFGNLTDRIFRSPGVFQGAVVDFISPKHFAVFNLADSAIVCGGILIVLLSFWGLDPDGTVHKD